jgi:RimJ/RimL family protein N-acetyltransferase
MATSPSTQTTGVDGRIRLETARLVLRPLAAEDAAEIVRLAGDVDVAEMTGEIPHPYTLTDAVEWLASVAGKPWALAICRRTDHALIGVINIVNDPGGLDPVELGYWIGKPYWGQGFMTEAAHCFIDHFFRVSGRHRVHAMVLAENTASRRVLEKLGFWPAGKVERFFAARAETRRLIVMEVSSGREGGA